MNDHYCSVSQCTNLAAVEVHLYDLYLHGDEVDVFDELDFTCPYLCAAHVEANERSAKGERRPRGLVRYLFTNQQQAPRLHSLSGPWHAIDARHLGCWTYWSRSLGTRRRQPVPARLGCKIRGHHPSMQLRPP
jgi:hypothetical protein